MRRFGINLTMVTLMALGIGACSGTVQEKLGLTNKVPDEFSVIRRKPLVEPPDFTTLPAPGTRTAGTAPTPAEEARQLLLGGDGDAPQSASPAEKVLLEEAAQPSLEDIRDILNNESEGAGS